MNEKNINKAIKKYLNSIDDSERIQIFLKFNSKEQEKIYQKLNEEDLEKYFSFKLRSTSFAKEYCENNIKLQKDKLHGIFKEVKEQMEAKYCIPDSTVKSQEAKIYEKTQPNNNSDLEPKLESTNFECKKFPKVECKKFPNLEFKKFTKPVAVEKKFVNLLTEKTKTLSKSDSFVHLLKSNENSPENLTTECSI